MLRSLYERMMRLAASRRAGLWLGVIAFCEGIFFPIPTDLMLMPMVLARRDRAWMYAAITLVCSVIGGTVGFFVGYLLKDVALFILSLTGMSAHTIAWAQAYLRASPLAYLLLALPVPYKLIAIASGMIPLSYPLFLMASTLIRGARYFLVAGLMRTYGAPIQGFIEKRLALLISAAAVVVVLALLLVRTLH